MKSRRSEREKNNPSKWIILLVLLTQAAKIIDRFVWLIGEDKSFMTRSITLIQCLALMLKYLPVKKPFYKKPRDLTRRRNVILSQPQHYLRK